MDNTSTTDSTTTSRNAGIAGDMALRRRPASPAANAVTHGLTATKFLPDVLGADVLERHRGRFAAEWRPSTPTEAFLVEELARHAAALERATPIEESVLRTAARGLGMMADFGGDPATDEDRVLAATCGAETIDRLTRYRRAHEKAFLATLARLRELRAGGAYVPVPAAPVNPLMALRFDEERCLRYLRIRRETGASGCPACGNTGGKSLTVRDLWQCARCRRQSSPRAGTVMEGSPLPVRTWFSAIAAILREPKTSTASLCTQTEIRREKTVRAVADKIRRALDSADRERLLAGLNATIVQELAASIG